MVKGAAWAVPVIVAASAAPAFAASVAGFLRLEHDVLAGCVGTSGIADVYYYLNIRNDSGAAYTLTEPWVITLTNTNSDRNKLPASTTHGTVENNGDIVTWTLPAGTVIPANSDVDVLWHFLSELGQPTSVTATTSSSLVVNQSSNSADRYGNGCTGQF